MCFAWSTRNRAVVLNHYSMQTLLTSKDAYCPCGPNYQDYSYRSRLYNPDPKYQCHIDLTCHPFDSIPKAVSCSTYNTPTSSPLATYVSSSLGSSGGCGLDPCRPAVVNTRPPPCKRRVRRPPECCPPRSTYHDLICNMLCCQPDPCCEPPPKPCCVEPRPPPNNNCDEEEDSANGNNNGGYSLELPPTSNDSCCASKVVYNCGPCGDICKTTQFPGGNQIQSESCDNYILLEASGNAGCACGGAIKPRVCVQPCEQPCCAPPRCLPPPRCPPRCPPPVCCPPPCPPRCPPQKRTQLAYGFLELPPPPRRKPCC